MRGQVDAKSQDATEALGAYTAMVSALLGAPAQLPKISSQPSITRTAQAYVDLLQAKERAGRERALLRGGGR
ncbi:nitrate- and nitrite sensing domain-containing protein [Thiorhodovibrio winogradskyi]|nr:nitrate- and nitrite sensing domain-containing protein [Thiorhodovibrio winogradskyi]